MVFKDWYNSIPYFTRHWITLSVVISLLARIRVIPPAKLYLMWEPLADDFEIWRPLSALFYYPPSFPFVFNLYIVYTYSTRLEGSMFAGKPADYIYMLTFNWIVCVVLGLLMSQPLLMPMMALSVLYVWAQLNRDVVVSFWFGTTFKAMYLPWVLLAFSVAMGGGLTELVGIIVGHLSFFLLVKYPQEFGGPAWLTPPDFLKRVFPESRVMGGFRAMAPEGRAPARPATNLVGGHQWGRGHVLGAN